MSRILGRGLMLILFRRIETMENDCFLLPNGLRVPISRTYQHPAREAFFRSLVDGEK